MESHIRNADYTKEYNRKQILRFLISTPLSRADLARKTGLTRAAISIITDELLQSGLIYEMPSVSAQKGRSPTPLALHNNAYYAIGVYISRDRCSVGLVNIKGEILRLYEHTTETLHSYEQTMELIVSDILQMQQQFIVDSDKILGVGFSCPGPVDIASARILTPPGFEAWHDKRPGDYITQRTGMPVCVENNAYSLANFEKRYGNARNIENFVLLLIDTGIGGGIVSKGKLFKGAKGFSGEIGHTSIQLGGKPCLCGHVGCLERYASIPALLEEYGLPLSAWQDVVKRAHEGDAKALGMLQTEVEYLSAGMISTLNLLNAEAVVLDGSILDVFDLIAEPLEKKVNGRVITRNYERVRIISADRRREHHMAAAANIQFDKFFE